LLAVFFFSSRRRHTIFSRDWSSDVCSSDLDGRLLHRELLRRPAGERKVQRIRFERRDDGGAIAHVQTHFDGRVFAREAGKRLRRSEERRVGKEGGARRRATQRPPASGRWRK